MIGLGKQILQLKFIDIPQLKKTISNFSLDLVTFTIFVFQINKGLDRQYPSAIDSEAIEPLSVLHIIELGAI